MPPVNIVVIFLEHVLRKSPFSLPLLMSSIIHCTSDRERKTHRSSPSTLYNTVFNVLPILYIGEGREEKNAVKLVKFAIALFFLLLLLLIRREQRDVGYYIEPFPFFLLRE